MKSTNAVMPAVFLAAVCAALWIPSSVYGQLTAAQNRELSRIRSDLNKVGSLVRRNKLDDAEKILNEVETRLKEIGKEADLKPNSKLLAGLYKSLEVQRHAHLMKKDPEEAKRQEEAKTTVSFRKHVAPILQEKCCECHGDKACGELHLDSFAGMKKGGKTGPVLVIGEPLQSLMMRRILARDEKNRMPPADAPALSKKEIQILGVWVKQGAKYDADDEELELQQLLKAPPPPVQVSRATGDETVSFKRDIAPFMVMYCLRCHSGARPQGDLSLETIEGFMRGGRKGACIVPGDPEKSLVYQLMGSFDEAIRMPIEPTVKVTKKNYDDMGIWIKEGAKYDGDDPRIPIEELNPTEDMVKAKKFGGMSAEEFVTHRETHTAEQWKEALPDQEPRSLKTKQILFYGNIPEGRMAEVAKWTEKHFETLRDIFQFGEDLQVWKGKLTVFLAKDEDSYQKLTSVILSGQTFGPTGSCMQITEIYDDAFIALQDTGDKSTADTPTLQFNLLNQLTEAYMATSKTFYPEWLRLGLGPALAAEEIRGRDKYTDELRYAAAEAVKGLETPTAVFEDGAFFSSDDTRPVGFTLVQFLLKRGRAKILGQFIKALEDGGDVANSLRVVYRAELEAIVKGYLPTLKTRRR